MGLLAKLFKRTPPPRALEAYVSKLTPSSMGRLLQGTKENLKIPTAQAMTVLLFAGMFAKGLRESADGMPEVMRSDWPYPYEKILTEAAGLYYFYMIKDYLSKPDEDGDWPDDDDEDEPAEADPHFESLKLSMHVCGALIHSLSDGLVSEKFVAGRAITYSDVQRRGKSVVDSLHGFIMKAWNPNPDGRTVLDLSAPVIPIQMAIAAMPIDSVRDACRELHDEKMKNPRAY